MVSFAFTSWQPIEACTEGILNVKMYIVLQMSHAFLFFSSIHMVLDSSDEIPSQMHCSTFFMDISATSFSAPISNMISFPED